MIQTPRSSFKNFVRKLTRLIAHARAFVLLELSERLQHGLILDSKTFSPNQHFHQFVLVSSYKQKLFKVLSCSVSVVSPQSGWQDFQLTQNGEVPRASGMTHVCYCYVLLITTLNCNSMQDYAGEKKKRLNKYTAARTHEERVKFRFTEGS